MKTIITAIILLSGILFTTKNIKAESTPANPVVTCSISGQVQDMKTGEALAGVKVILAGTDKVVYSDLDGKFSISNVNPGSYDLTVSLISYDNSLIENLQVKPGESEEVTVKLINQ